MLGIIINFKVRRRSRNRTYVYNPYVLCATTGGVGAYEYPQALNMCGNTGGGMELARGIEPPTG